MEEAATVFPLPMFFCFQEPSFFSIYSEFSECVCFCCLLFCLGHHIVPVTYSRLRALRVCICRYTLLV